MIYSCRFGVRSSNQNKKSKRISFLFVVWVYFYSNLVDVFLTMLRFVWVSESESTPILGKTIQIRDNRGGVKDDGYFAPS